MHIPKLAKYAVVKVWLQVESPLSPILRLDINTIVGQRFNAFDVPVHGITGSDFNMQENGHATRPKRPRSQARRRGSPAPRDRTRIHPGSARREVPAVPLPAVPEPHQYVGFRAVAARCVVGLVNRRRPLDGPTGRDSSA